ncbi:unnamed protein product [Owenia fusiformis]|uniref:Sulfotransferase domain-containing protein n=1 Tax=Owenia fusiformis TaxID=6347 RepID=A0A8S4NM83_OWEFU|nr:unnamed protein product [Owenia fusiformis]
MFVRCYMKCNLCLLIIWLCCLVTTVTFLGDLKFFFNLESTMDTSSNEHEVKNPSTPLPKYGMAKSQYNNYVLNKKIGIQNILDRNPSIAGKKLFDELDEINNEERSNLYETALLMKKVEAFTVPQDTMKCYNLTTGEFRFSNVCRKVEFGWFQPLTALASYPGSGNTWTRHLIEQLTGVYTGSIYDANALKRGGFMGESRRDNSVIVIKTHESPAKSNISFTRAVLIIRNPFEAMMSEFKREYMQEHGQIDSLAATYLPDNLFTKYKSQWEFFFYGKQWAANYWYNFYATYIQLFLNGRTIEDLLVIKYEDMKTNLERELRKLAKFFKIDVSDNVVNCVVCNAEGNFHRKHYKRKHDTETDPFDDGMKAQLNKYKDVMDCILDNGLNEDGTFSRNNHTIMELCSYKHDFAGAAF